MTAVTLFIAMSLDGYIADTTGQIGFLDSVEMVEEDSIYEDFIKNIDTVVIGSTTYNQIIDELSPEEYPYKEMTSYVLSSQKNNKGKPNVEIIDVPVEELIRSLKQGNGKGIWIVGGSSIINPLIEADLIDFYEISIVPHLLGDGIPLFTEKLQQIPLQLDATIVRNGMIHTKYSKKS